MAKDKFSGITDEELKAELISREADRRAAINAATKKCAQLVLDNVDLLLQLVPTHDTINCSDEHLASAYNDHGRPRCRRCRLLEIKQEGYNYETVLEIQLQTSEELDNTPDNMMVHVQDRHPRKER